MFVLTFIIYVRPDTHNLCRLDIHIPIFVLTFFFYVRLDIHIMSVWHYVRLHSHSLTLDESINLYHVPRLEFWPCVMGKQAARLERHEVNRVWMRRTMRCRRTKVWVVLRRNVGGGKRINLHLVETHARTEIVAGRFDIDAATPLKNIVDGRLQPHAVVHHQAAIQERETRRQEGGETHGIACQALELGQDCIVARAQDAERLRRIQVGEKQLFNVGGDDIEQQRRVQVAQEEKAHLRRRRVHGFAEQAREERDDFLEQVGRAAHHKHARRLHHVPAVHHGEKHLVLEAHVMQARVGRRHMRVDGVVGKQPQVAIHFLHVGGRLRVANVLGRNLRKHIAQARKHQLVLVQKMRAVGREAHRRRNVLHEVEVHRHQQRRRHALLLARVERMAEHRKHAVAETARRVGRGLRVVDGHEQQDVQKRRGHLRVAVFVEKQAEAADDRGVVLDQAHREKMPLRPRHAARAVAEHIGHKVVGGEVDEAQKHDAVLAGAQDEEADPHVVQVADLGQGRGAAVHERAQRRKHRVEAGLAVGRRRARAKQKRPGARAQKRAARAGAGARPRACARRFGEHVDGVDDLRVVVGEQVVEVLRGVLRGHEVGKAVGDAVGEADIETGLVVELVDARLELDPVEVVPVDVPVKLIVPVVPVVPVGVEVIEVVVEVVPVAPAAPVGLARRRGPRAGAAQQIRLRRLLLVRPLGRPEHRQLVLGVVQVLAAHAVLDAVGACWEVFHALDAPPLACGTAQLGVSVFLAPGRFLGRHGAGTRLAMPHYISRPVCVQNAKVAVCTWGRLTQACRRACTPPNAGPLAVGTAGLGAS